jgi:hypothetical protein
MIPFFVLQHLQQSFLWHLQKLQKLFFIGEKCGKLGRLLPSHGCHCGKAQTVSKYNRVNVREHPPQHIGRNRGYPLSGFGIPSQGITPRHNHHGHK